jgi:hypothetical protein
MLQIYVSFQDKDYTLNKKYKWSKVILTLEVWTISSTFISGKKLQINQLIRTERDRNNVTLKVATHHMLRKHSGNPVMHLRIEIN